MIVGTSPSSSVAVAKQVKFELVVTPVLGVILGPEITGGEFCTSIWAPPMGPTPPSGSVGVTTTVHVSPAVVADDGMVADVYPEVAPSRVQA